MENNFFDEEEDIVVIWRKEREEVTMRGPRGPKNMMLKSLGIIEMKYDA